MANKTTGRSKKSPNKSLKEPIPITSGTTSLQSASSSIHTEKMLHTQGIDEEIRRRAYELYEERGRQEGLEVQDWVRAETEILSKYNRERSA